MTNFAGFSPDSFEQLVRALAVKVFGPGVTAFGDGPDGGREAIFKGKVPYPYSPVENWDGLGVVQAKFKAKSESTSKDQAWALAELKKELAQWIISKKRRPKPDYFVFCTNVSLTSVSGGGKDQAAKQLGLKKNGFKDFAIWDANQLQALIDGQAEIRQRFCHFFSTGDLLWEYSQSLKFGRVDAEGVLHNYVAREFMADEDARLSQAGDRSEDRIQLADVFVDLPSGAEQIHEPSDFMVDEFSEGSLKDLLKAGANKLDPLALTESTRIADDGTTASSNIMGRYVYLGGPGSGKSTIGQFLAQVHRAALLSRRPPHRLEQNVRALISAVQIRCEADSCVMPATPRYPFRIELNTFAKALSAKDATSVASLSEYLRRELSKDVEIAHDDLKRWLASYPWLLIFDGLDEVPPSSNRREVVSAIQEFLNEARDVEADLLIVASSRPDGYAGEFDGSEVAHRHLLPLSPERALLCAQKYVTAKIARKDQRRADEAMQTLMEAVKNPLVAKLMHSPLQVTFMVTVVAASGKPSESRWQLFNDYYRTIYERELHKAVPPFDKALNERRSDIDALHHRVGFILQTRAELAGGTQADMAVEEFEALVRECLGENGLSQNELDHQTKMILGAAGQRLVFLTSRTPGRLSFDVRSLQEYMAAACLTNEDSGEAIRRLEYITNSSYWRNVLLFAIGRFFVDHHLRPHREKVRILCDDLNRRSVSDEKARMGSRLALDVLVSGVIGNVPMASRALIVVALKMLHFPPDKEGGSLEALALVYRDDARKDYEDEIRLHLGQADSDLTLSAWVLLRFLSERSVVWADEIMVGAWPEDQNHAINIVGAWLRGSSYVRPKLVGVPASLFVRLAPSASPAKFSRLIPSLGLEVESDQPWMPFLIGLFSEVNSTPIKIYHHDKFSGASGYVNQIGFFRLMK